ncbi:MAG: hypothetical protein ABII90_07180 [Bacteroidota bacterium]
MKFIFLLLFLSISLSCSKKTVPASETKEQPAQQTIVKRDYAKEKYVKATVIDMTGLDGCKFLLKLEDGKKLEPTNLDPAYRKDSLPVWIRYIETKGVMSICMAGKIVKIIGIERRE